MKYFNMLVGQSSSLAKVEVVGSNPIARSNHWRISNTLPSELSASSGRFRQISAEQSKNRPAELSNIRAVGSGSIRVVGRRWLTRPPPAVNGVC